MSAKIEVTYDTPRGHERSHKQSSVTVSDHSARIIESLMVRLALADERFDFDAK